MSQYRKNPTQILTTSPQSHQGAVGSFNAVAYQPVAAYQPCLPTKNSMTYQSSVVNNAIASGVANGVANGVAKAVNNTVTYQPCLPSH